MGAPKASLVLIVAFLASLTVFPSPGLTSDGGQINPSPIGFVPMLGIGYLVSVSHDGHIAMASYVETASGWNLYNIYIINNRSLLWGRYFDNYEVASLCWSSDSRMLVVGYNEAANAAEVEAYHVNGSLAWSHYYYEEQVHYVSCSPRGTRIAVVTDTALYIYNRSGAEISRTRVADVIGSVGWSPNGEFLAVSGYSDGKYSIFIFDNNGSKVEEFRAGVTFVLDWSPDSRRIVYSWGGSYLTISDINGSIIVNRTTRTLIYSVAWNPRGESIATLSRSPYNNTIFLTIYDINGNIEWRTALGVNLTEEELKASEILWSPNGNIIIVKTPDKIMAYSDGGEPLWSHGGGVFNDAAWSSDGTLIVAGAFDDKRLAGIRAYRADGSVEWSLIGTLGIPIAASSCGGSRLAVVGGREVYLVTPEGVAWRAAPSPPDNTRTMSMWWPPRCSPDGSIVIVPVELEARDSKVYIGLYAYDANTGNLLWNITNIRGGLAGSTSNPAWSPDGALLAVVARDRVIAYSRDGSEVWEVGTGNRTYLNIAWSPDGDVVAVSGYDKVLYILRNGSIITNTTIELGGGAPKIMEMKWSPRGALALRFWAKKVVVITDENGSIIMEINTSYLPREVEWSPDGRYLAIAGRHSLDVFDAGTGKEVWSRDLDQEIKGLSWERLNDITFLIINANNKIKIISIFNKTISEIEVPLSQCWESTLLENGILAITGPGGVLFYTLTGGSLGNETSSPSGTATTQEATTKTSATGTGTVSGGGGFTGETETPSTPGRTTESSPEMLSQLSVKIILIVIIVFTLVLVIYKILK